MIDKRERDSVTEQVREKFNPNWRKYLKMHLESLGKTDVKKVLNPRRRSQ